MRKYLVPPKILKTIENLHFALLFLLIFNSCDQSAKNTMAMLDDSTIMRLSKKIATRPIQLEVDSLVSQLDISISNPHSEIISALTKLFNNESTLQLILTSLSTYTVPNFDFELSKFPFKINELENPQAQMWLNAVKRSGGNMCFDTLSIVAVTPLIKPTNSIALHRGNLFITLSSINYINACKQALIFYLKRGDDELEQIAENQNPIIYLIKNLPQKRASFPELYDFLNFFIPYRTATFTFGDSVSHDAQIEQVKAQFQTHPMLRVTVAAIVEEISNIDAPYARSFVGSIQGIPFYDSLNEKHLGKFKYYKQYPRLPFLGGILRKFGTKNLSSINIEYHEVTYKIVSDILKRYQFDSLPKVEIDKLIDSFFASFPNLEKSPNISSITNLQYFVTGCITKVLKQDNPNVPNIHLLAISIVQKEFDIINLSLYAIAKVRDKKHIKRQFSLDQYDAELYKLSSLPPEKGDLISDFTDNILPMAEILPSGEDSSLFFTSLTASAETQSKDTNYLLKKFLNDKELRNINNLISSNINFKDKMINDVELVGRIFSISQGMYVETLKVYYDKGEESMVKWYGLIPQKYFLALIRFPRAFDLADISFAKEEWKNSVWRNYNFKTEAEVVLMNSVNSLPLLLYNLRNDSIPLEFIIDEIRLVNAFHLNYQPSYIFDVDYFGKEKASSVSSFALEEIKKSAIAPIVPLRPKTLIQFKQWYNNMDSSTRWFLYRGYPTTINAFFGNYFCHSSAEYDTMKQFLFMPLNYLVCYKITDMAYGPIRKYIQDNQNDFVGDVPLLSWLAPRVFGNWNKAKESNLWTCDNNIARARASVDYMSDWDFLNMPINASMSVVMRQTIIDSTFTKFLATYQINFLNGQVKFVTLEGSFDKLPASIKDYILRNQNLVQIANLDLSSATISASDYFQRVYQTFTSDSYGQFSTETLLKISGYLWLQPLARPQTPYFLLYNSPNGKILASEIKTYLKLWDIGRFGSNIYNYTPTEEFMTCLRDIQRQVNHSIAENATRMSNEQIAEIKKKEEDEKEYSFSVSFGGQGTTYSANYSNGNLNIGLGVFNPTNGQMTGFASLNGMSVYSLNLTPTVNANNGAFNNSLAMTELRIQSGLNIPLNSIVTAAERINRSPASSNASSSYWHKNSHGSLEYSGPVVVINDGSFLSYNHPILGPYKIDQNMMAKYDIKGREVIKILEEVSSKISREKAQEYLKALDNKSFTPNQFNELLELRKQVFEQTMIEDGTWAQTEIVESLLPDKRYPGTIENIDAYLKDINKAESDIFSSALSDKSKELKTDNVVDKQVRWKIIYDKDYNFMRLEQYFIFKDGDVQRLAFTERIPFFLNKELLRKDPNGHLYEKMMKSLLDPNRNSDPHGTGISKGDKATIDKILKITLKPLASDMKDWSEQKKKYIESLTVKDSLERIKENYFNNLKAWLSDPANQGQFVPKPFTVSPLEFPFLYLYPYSDVNFYRLEYLKERVMQSQKSSFFYSRIMSGGNMVLH